MDDGHALDIDRHVRIYVSVFVGLMALTLITVGVSYLHLPFRMAVGLALLIATVKGSLVACYFMHLISERRLIYVVLAITGAFFIALLLLPVLSHVGSTEVAGTPVVAPESKPVEGHQ